MAGTTDQEFRRTRIRAKKACKTCNSRRIKCNVVEVQPCTNCARADVTCELMSSKRGKYDRSIALSRHGVKSSPSTYGDMETAISPTGPFQVSPGEGELKEDSRYSQAFMSTPDRLHEGQHKSNQSVSRDTTSPEYPTTTNVTVASLIHSTSGPESTVFLGESNSITSFSNPNPSAAGDNKGFQYSIPDAVSAKTATTPLDMRRKVAKVQALRKDGALSFPSNSACETLFRAYFTWFHPCFPIMKRITFYNSYISKTTSPLLLQSILFVGASYCNEKTLQGIGMPDRYEARSTFYNRAKDIYDADYETDKVIVCQALFLMSFWRAGPLLEKDTRHWLGAAISLAQTKGMHRSSVTSFSDAKLRKRIWWSLYVRDRQCSAALGLPIRIRDEDCDIEMLDESDFDDLHTAIPTDFLGSQKHEHVLYAIQMAKLARLLGKIILREFSPNSDTDKNLDRSKLNDELMLWENALSPAMTSSASAKSFWAAMLHIAYNNLHILLYRSAYLETSDNVDKEVGQIALEAACRNTRILEDLLAQDLVQHGNVHLITSIFNSLCIHTVHLRRSSSSTVKKLAEYRAQLCLLGLRELQNTWDVTNWVLQLYFQFLDQSTTKRLQLVDSEDAQTAPRNNAFISHDSPANASDTVTGSDSTIPARAGEQTFSNPELNSGRPTMQTRHLVDNLDFVSHLFSSQEAEDFSMFQLQPDLFAGDMFGGGLDHYYNSMIPRMGPSTESL